MSHSGSEAFPTANSSDSFDAIILDLGGVIINLDLNRCYQRFLEHVPNIDPITFVGKPQQMDFYSDFEVGKIEADELLRKFNEHHGSSMSMDLFADCWNSMVLDFPQGRIERLRSLGKRKRLFLLSNINEIHEGVLHKRYERFSAEPFSRLFERMYLSHRIGMRKPDPEVFQHLIDENGLEPGRTLFIDDSKQHVVGAAETGIRAVHLTETHTLETLLESLGIRM
jgi:putative hydrolase of the HAD superfamily